MDIHHPKLSVSHTRRKGKSFRQLFLWYCASIVGITLTLSSILELIFFKWYMDARNAVPETFPPSLILWLAVILPCLILFVSMLFFAWRMGRKISKPVNELMQAVTHIRQQNLDFTMTYQEQNELGDLCFAFNELRSELQISLEREWRKQEEIRTMVSALSHDLRTPVAIIQGHIEGLLRAEAGEKRHQRLERYLPVLEASSQRMRRLLNDILLVSALEETAFLLQPQAVALEQALDRKSQMYTLQASSAHITFRYHYTATETTPVFLDFHRLEQILDNLFDNALRHTPVNGQISLFWTRSGNHLTIVVRDTGSGIALVDLPHIWKKFYHGQASTDGKIQKTTGLGLYTCKLLVERHGGTITLRNHPDGGCEVVLSLPL